MRPLSDISNSLIGQPMFQVIDAVAKLEREGRDVVHFEIGEPDFETPAPITSAAVEALTNGDTHYVSSWGLHDFIETARSATLNSRGFLPDYRQVLVTPGANIATYLAIVSAVNPGEEVLYPDPGFPTYRASVLAAGVEGRTYPLQSSDGFRIRADLIEPVITDKTRLLIINSPSNPTGAVTEAKELEKVFNLAEKHNLLVFSDEIYARLIFEEDFFSMGSIDRCAERVIISNGFSKAFAMTGWRLGIVVGPEAILEKMMLLLQTTLSCVPPFIQRAGIAAIDGDQSAVRLMLEAYRSRRDLVVNRVGAMKGVFVEKPGGAFYLFPSIRDTGLSSEEFCRRLLHEEAVALLPGGNFGPAGEGFVRMSYASSEARLNEGLDRMSRFCESL